MKISFWITLTYPHNVQTWYNSEGGNAIWNSCNITISTLKRVFKIVEARLKNDVQRRIHDLDPLNKQKTWCGAHIGDEPK